MAKKLLIAQTDQIKATALEGISFDPGTFKKKPEAGGQSDKLALGERLIDTVRNSNARVEDDRK